MAQINKPGLHFNTVLYSGTGSYQSITGVGFQPDFVWGKNRDTTNYHDLEDVVRGATKRLSSNVIDAEATETVNFTSFDSDGFSVGTGDNVNKSGSNIVVWNWKANGAGSSNSNGSITSTVSANTTAGFSIVSWTSDGGNTSTAGHSLGTTPQIIIYKSRGSGAWYVWLNQLIDSSHDYLVLNSTNAKTDIDTSTYGTPSSTVISNFGFANSENMIAYCFAEKKGYSKFGSYTGNGNANGTFVYTGFKPAWVLVKRTDSSTDWKLFDNKLNPFNQTNLALRPNLSNGEQTGNYMDLSSNGFKWRTTDTVVNASGNSYIFMAFAENPIVGSNNVPAVAR